MLAALVAALGACGGSTPAAATPIVFGTIGGSIAPYRFTIQPDGNVRSTGSARGIRRQISAARVGQLTNEIRQAHLANRSCAGVLPDVAGLYIRADGRTVTVHGGCEPQFRRVWDDLSRAVALPVS